MARRVVAVLRRGLAEGCGHDRALEASAYAVAVDLDLALLLADDAVELAVADRAGLAWSAPRASVGRWGEEEALGEAADAGGAPGTDLRGLVESGVTVLAAARDVRARGLRPGDLVAGVRAIDDVAVAELLRAADAVVNW